MLIEQMKAKLVKLKEEEQELRKGLGIFRIDHPFSKDIQNLEKVLHFCYHLIEIEVKFKFEIILKGR